MTEDKTVKEEPQEEKKEESEEKPKESSETTAEKQEETRKKRFTFKCTRCDKCCLERGPIPITFWDLELWARNGVLANFLPYLEVYNKPDAGFDLILKPLPPAPAEGEEETKKDPFTGVSIEQLLEEKCPLYNKEQNKCLVYDNRPLSCRTYPLEFDGKNYKVVDLECPGIGEEGMTKEDLKEMRENAKTMNYELTRIRIALPVLNQIISRNLMTELMKQQMAAMEKMSPEDKAKLDEIFQKGQQADQEEP